MMRLPKWVTLQLRLLFLTLVQVQVQLRLCLRSQMRLWTRLKLSLLV